MLSDTSGGGQKPLTAKIRDARGLSAYEKLFLLIVASHQRIMWKSSAEAAEDMGMHRATFFRVGASLIDKNLLITRQSGGSKKVVQYEINIAVLDDWTGVPAGRYHVAQCDIDVAEDDIDVAESDSACRTVRHKEEQKKKEKEKAKGIVVSLENRKAVR